MGTARRDCIWDRLFSAGPSPAATSDLKSGNSERGSPNSLAPCGGPQCLGPAVPADRSQQDAAVSLEGFPHFALCYYLAPDSPDRRYSRCPHFANGSPGETQEEAAHPRLLARPHLPCRQLSGTGTCTLRGAGSRRHMQASQVLAERRSTCPRWCKLCSLLRFSRAAVGRKGDPRAPSP